MADIQTWNVTEPYISMKCGLGEAPFYEDETKSLRFVDIVKQKLHIVNLKEGPHSLESFDLSDPVSTTADIEGDGDKIIVGAKNGFAFMDRKTKKLDYINKVWGEKDGLGKDERMRFNDGFVDPEGRYFAGTMNDPLKTQLTDEGVLFRLDPNLNLHRVIEKVTIPNGMGFTLDEKSMYFIDSPTKNIWKFQYNRDSGDISNREVFYHVVHAGVPDGMAMDVDGSLWVALAGGGKVLKISSEGKLVGEINLPTRMITCPAFAGEDLYITSAEEEEPSTYPDSVKYGGSLFRIHVGVKGLPVYKFQRA
ncbi:rRNA-processing protein cgr1 [Lecanora helva]